MLKIIKNGGKLGGSGQIQGLDSFSAERIQRDSRPGFSFWLGFSENLRKIRVDL